MVLKWQYHLLIKIKSIIKKENLILINIIKRRVTKNIKVIIDTKEVKCFKCSQIGHIAPNCKKHKLNDLFYNDYYSEIFEDNYSFSLEHSKNNKS